MTAMTNEEFADIELVDQCIEPGELIETDLIEFKGRLRFLRGQS